MTLSYSELPSIVVGILESAWLAFLARVEIGEVGLPVMMRKSSVSKFVQMDQHEFVQVLARFRKKNNMVHSGWSPVWCQPQSLR